MNFAWRPSSILGKRIFLKNEQKEEKKEKEGKKKGTERIAGVSKFPLENPLIDSSTSAVTQRGLRIQVVRARAIIHRHMAPSDGALYRYEKRTEIKRA